MAGSHGAPLIHTCSSAQVTRTCIDSPQRCSRSARALLRALGDAGRRKQRWDRARLPNWLLHELCNPGWCSRGRRRPELRDPLLCKFTALGKLLLSGGQLRPGLIPSPNAAALVIPSRGEVFLQGPHVLLKTRTLGSELVTFGLNATDLPYELVLDRGEEPT